MWPVGSLIKLDASCKHSSLNGLNQALHFRWNRGCGECSDLRARPEFEPIKAQPERFHADQALRLVQLINTLNREFADVNQCYVPVAALNGPAFNEFCDRADEIAHAITLPMVRPQSEKQAFRSH
jgi:hypothetical protein